MDEKLKLITEKHKIMYMKSMQINDKEKMIIAANEVIDLICKDINWNKNRFIVVGTMTNHMLKSTNDIINLITKESSI